ncbi:UvrD-helicase domain-containing protein [Luethyella okanaganae]|uniref:UvrD-helicase domain-containing protein n=1 Tax=Luethyella okanaganae TaxID=69372 RepID=A0ABW1VET8_9MICO
MILTASQRAILDSTAPALVVLGGAGTGKTTTAAHLVRQTLESASRDGRRERALFLSFSRAAAAQIMSRSGDILGPFADRVEVTTFHALAWRLITRWGGVLGVDDPVLFSPAERKVFGTSEGLGYSDLIPLALRLLDVPAIKEHVAARWSLVVVDEFQDTNDEHWALVRALSANARLVLLGDLDQCIYKVLPDNPGVGPQRVAAAMKLKGAIKITLPDVSHRDPSYIIPAAANAIRDRDFTSPAIRTALEANMLEVVHESAVSGEAAAVVSQVNQLVEQGLSVGVFSHHIDSTAQLSDDLNAAGVAHEIVGLPDAVDAALRAQYAMLQLACEEAEANDVLRAVAIFVASAERGADPPARALMIAGLAPRPESLTKRLDKLARVLHRATSLKAAFEIASDAYDAIGLQRGASAWRSAGRLLSNVLGPRVLGAEGLPPGGLSHAREAIDQQHIALLTNVAAGQQAPVQLMGLYQTKGREVDAAIVLLRSSDWYGRESEPMPDGSKLLYVLMTRARKKTVVLTIGRPMKPLVAPLAALA